MKSLLALMLVATPAALAAQKSSAPSPSVSASEVSAASIQDFDSFVSKASEPKAWTMTRLHSKTGKWNKQYYRLQGVKFDVVKTNSLVSPARGMVEFPVEVTQSPDFDSEQDAMQSSNLGPLRITYYFTADYSLRSAKWALEKMSYRVGILGRAPDPTMFSASRDEILNDTGFGQGLSRMVSSWVR